MASLLAGGSRNANRERGQQNGDSELYLCRLYLNGSLKTGSALQDFDQGLTEARRGRRNLDPGRLHGCDFGFGVALAARDDRAGMAHAATRRGGSASDEAYHRLLAASLGFILEELRGVLLRRTADLPDHDNRLGLGVSQK